MVLCLLYQVVEELLLWYGVMPNIPSSGGVAIVVWCYAYCCPITSSEGVAIVVWCYAHYNK